MAAPTVSTEFPVLSARRHPRAVCQTPAEIIISSKVPPIKCMVLDISASGAGLSLWVGSTFGIPESFELAIEGQATRRGCRLVWRQPHRLGVEFR